MSGKSEFWWFFLHSYTTDLQKKKKLLFVVSEGKKEKENTGTTILWMGFQLIRGLIDHLEYSEGSLKFMLCKFI